jgi:hypothetical protein
MQQKNDSDFCNTTPTLAQVVLKHLDGHGFEELCKRVFERLGYRNVTLGRRKKDSGADIIMVSPNYERVIVQCKHYLGRGIGRSTIDELYATAKRFLADIGMLVTTGYFTENAKKCASDFDIKLELIDFIRFREIARQAGFIVYTDDPNQSPKSTTNLLEQIPTGVEQHPVENQVEHAKAVIYRLTNGAERDGKNSSVSNEVVKMKAVNHEPVTFSKGASTLSGRRVVGQGKKVKVGVFMPEDLIEKFRSLIHQKYKSYEKGLLSYEFELLIRHWIDLHTNTLTQDIATPNLTPRVALVFALVKKYLLDNFYFELRPGQQIPLAHLEKAIMEVRGTDPRTVRKWLQTFHRMGLAKPITPYVWEIL